jgi:hypothetical protein
MCKLTTPLSMCIPGDPVLYIDIDNNFGVSWIVCVSLLYHDVKHSRISIDVFGANTQ